MLHRLRVFGNRVQKNNWTSRATIWAVHVAHMVEIRIAFVYLNGKDHTGNIDVYVEG
jgi:hypothetical protein